jgi:hypothetical protein
MANDRLAAGKIQLPTDATATPGDHTPEIRKLLIGVKPWHNRAAAQKLRTRQTDT